ncbi:MAG: hypothetical protein Q9212_007360, partial [Teloschistes hypoglaucus]
EASLPSLAREVKESATRLRHSSEEKELQRGLRHSSEEKELQRGLRHSSEAKELQRGLRHSSEAKELQRNDNIDLFTEHVRLPESEITNDLTNTASSQSVTQKFKHSVITSHPPQYVHTRIEVNESASQQVSKSTGQQVNKSASQQISTSISTLISTSISTSYGNAHGI